MKRPDFILIGAMKSGTTALARYLDLHPRIFMSHPKEPGFFSRPEVFSRGVNWYLSLFARAAPDQVCGEASTCYSRWPTFDGVPEKMHVELPDVKLVYLMRHPVERCYSHYRHLMEERFFWKGEQILRLEDALEEIPEIVDASRYTMQIDRYLSLYARDRMLLLTTDELRSSRDSLLSEIQRFLGVEEVTLTEGGPVEENRAGDTFGRRAERRHFQSLKTPIRLRLAKLVPSGVRRMLRGRHSQSRRVKAFTEEKEREFRTLVSPFEENVRIRLLETLREPTIELERFLERQLPTWFE